MHRTKSRVSKRHAYRCVFLFRVCCPRNDILAHGDDDEKYYRHFGQTHFAHMSVIIHGRLPIWQTIFQYIVVSEMPRHQRIRVEITITIETYELTTEFLNFSRTFLVSMSLSTPRKRTLNFGIEHSHLRHRFYLDEAQSTEHGMHVGLQQL